MIRLGGYEQVRIRFYMSQTCSFSLSPNWRLDNPGVLFHEHLALYVISINWYLGNSTTNKKLKQAYQYFKISLLIRGLVFQLFGLLSHRFCESNASLL